MIETLDKSYWNRKMLINKLDTSSFNVEVFNSLFDTYKLEYVGEKAWISFNAPFFDRLDKKRDILSVSFTGGKIVNILMPKGKGINLYDFMNSDEASDYKLEKFKVDLIDKEKNLINIYTAYNLLLNALPVLKKTNNENDVKTDENMNFFNIQGHLYLYVPTLKASSNQEIMMEFKINKKGLLCRTQLSFMLADEKTKKSLPKYNISQGPNGTVVLSKYNGKGKAYIKKGMYNKKVRLNVEDFKYIESDITKVKIYSKLIKIFNNRYKNIAKLEFEQKNVKTKAIKTNRKLKKNKIDNINTFENLAFIELEKPKSEKEEKAVCILKEKIKKLYPEVVFLDECKQDFHNIVLIHNQEYYSENNLEDAKKKILTYNITQSVTLEGLIGKTENVIEAEVIHIFNELHVKKELYNKKIERWNFGEYEFFAGYTRKVKEEKKFFCCLMHIYEDGTFEMTSEKEVVDKYKKYFLNGNFNNEVFIVGKNDDYNKIKHTDYMPLIDVNELDDWLDYSKNIIGNKTTKSKDGKIQKNGLITPYYGKSVMEIDGKIHYCIGNNDLNLVVTSMCNIYAIEPLESSSIIMEILELLEDSFVRVANSESVKPYPFKYINEYLRNNNPGVIF